MSNKILTIDIQKNQLVSVLLVHNLKGFHIAQAEFFRLDKKKENFFKTLKDSLEQILSKTQNNFDRCIVSIPSNYFFFRTIELPFKNQKKNSQILSFELEEFLPCQIDKVEYDFCTLDKNSKKNLAGNLAGVASIQKKNLELFKNIFAQSNIHPDIVTIGTGYSSALAFARTAAKSSFSYFVHMEQTLAAVYAIKYNEIVYIRTIILSSQDLIKSIKSNLMHTFLSFNDLLNDSQQLDKIIVSGTTSFFKKIIIDIEKIMNVPVDNFNIFKTETSTLSSDSVLSRNDKFYELQNAVAMGINEAQGIKSFNLAKQVSKPELFFQEKKTSIIVTSVLLFFFFISWIINPIMEAARLEKNINNLNNKTIQVFKSCFPDINTIIDPAHQMQVELTTLQKKGNLDFFADYPFCIDLLNDISTVLPDSLDINISRFVRNKYNLLISGNADNFKTIDKMKKYFKRIELFKNVNIHSASMDKKNKRVQFHLKIVLE